MKTAGSDRKGCRMPWRCKEGHCGRTPSPLGDKRKGDRDVLHIPGLGFDGLVGYSPIAMAKNAVGMTLACEEYGASFFENGATPGGVLEHPGVLKDPARVSGYVKAKTGNKTSAETYANWYKSVYLPEPKAVDAETEGQG